MPKPTLADRLLDNRGHSRFLKGIKLTMDQFRQKLEDPDPAVRGFYIGMMMRNATADDVLATVDWGTILDLWSEIEPHLGSPSNRRFWNWLRAESRRPRGRR